MKQCEKQEDLVQPKSNDPETGDTVLSLNKYTLHKCFFNMNSIFF